jgi:tocopherol cyclase
MMLHRLKNIWRPAVYHGRGAGGAFFEGWYFKLVDELKKSVFAVIPAVYYDENERNSHASIQVFDGMKNTHLFHRYPLSEFKYESDRFLVSIGPNRFSSTAIELDVQSTGRRINGELSFGPLKPWPVKWLSPGAMGYYGLLPFMQCYHAVLSFDHRLTGSLAVDGNEIGFDNGRGYIEKDWGSGFPSAYAWIQCNHFQRPGTSLMVSVANIPWLKSSFRGFIIGFLHDSRLYRFTSYTAAELEKFEINEQRVNVVVSDRNYCLEISAVRKDGVYLWGPDEKGFGSRMRETLDTDVSLRFTQKDARRRLIFDGTGAPAALDVNGRLKEIVS